MVDKVDISELSVVEIKAMVYDESQKINQAQRNIQILEQEITNRVNKSLPKKDDSTGQAKKVKSDKGGIYDGSGAR